MTIEELLSMQVQRQTPTQTDIPGILAQMVAGPRQSGMPELPSFAQPQPMQSMPQINLPEIRQQGSGVGKSLVGMLMNNIEAMQKSKAETDAVQGVAALAPTLFDEMIANEKDPRALAQLRSNRAALASGDPILVKTAMQNWNEYQSSRMPDINRTTTAKDIEAQGLEPGTVAYQEAMKEQNTSRNAPSGMRMNAQGQLEYLPMAGGGTYQQEKDRISPSEQIRINIAKASAVRQDTAAERAAVAAEKGSKAQTFQQVNTLRDEFNVLAKPQVDAMRVFSGIQSTLGAKKPNAQTDMAGTYMFMKSLDPTSTVREGEYATAQNAVGVPDRIRNAWNKMIDGEMLTDEQRSHMLGVGQEMYTNAESVYKQHRARYGDIAKRWGVNPADVTADYTLPGKEARTKTATLPIRPMESFNTYQEYVDYENKRRGQ